MPNLIHYLLNIIVFITSVVAFEAVGAILLISLMIWTSYNGIFNFKRFKKRRMMIYSMIIGIVSSLIGYRFAIKLDVSTIDLYQLYRE